MEVQDHPDQDESLVRSSTRAEPGKAYPVRLLHFANGLIVIGYVIEVFPETTLVLRPHVLDVDFNRHTENVEEYEFSPYLDQMAHYDPSDMIPTAFMNASMISLTRPSDHVVQNYVSVVQIKEAVATTEPHEAIEFLYRSGIPSAKTLH